MTTMNGHRERFCECSLPCPCNVPVEIPGRLCAECRRGNHMDRFTAERRGPEER